MIEKENWKKTFNLDEYDHDHDKNKSKNEKSFIGHIFPTENI